MNGLLAKTKVDETLPSQVNPTYPGPPWFRWQEARGVTAFCVEIRGRMTTLPFLSYREVGGRVIQYGTEGINQGVYSQEVILKPNSTSTKCNIDHDPEYFMRDPTLNYVIAQALEKEGDLELTAEVAHFQALHGQISGVVERGEVIDWLLLDMESFKTKYLAIQASFAHKLHQSQECLVKGHVCLRVECATQHLAETHKIGGQYYWPGLPGMHEHPY